MPTSSEDVVVACEGLGKAYRMYAAPHDRLKQAILPRLRRLAWPGSRRTPPTYFREFWALRDVSFEIRRGERVGIVGRNGSGKSTLLQLVCGTVSPTIGQVCTAGRISALLELGAGFNPEFTGAENVRLYASLLGLTPAQIEERFDAIAAFADIGPFIDQPVKAYSSGMYVRLAFAVAVHTDPEVLIVDEALAVGDFAFQAKCMRRMHRYLDAGGTLLYVSHDLGSVKSLCTRALYLQAGVLRDIGPAERVVERYLEDVHREEGLAVTPVATAATVRTDEAATGDAGALERFRAAVAPFRRHASEACEFVSAEVLDARGSRVGVARWGETLAVRAGLHVHAPVDELVVALYVRDRLQIDLMGTNTQYEGCVLRGLQPGERVTLTFAFENWLHAGEYGICLIAADRPVSTGRFYDWIDLATSFRAADRAGQQAWALFNPGIRVQAQREARVVA